MHEHPDMHYDDPHGHPHPEEQYHSTHGIDLNFVGGNVETPYGTHPELAAAAVSPTEAVIQVNGESIIAPISHINPDKVELACESTPEQSGCVLIPDDGNPYNDVHVGGMHEPTPDPYYNGDHYISHSANDELAVEAARPVEPVPVKPAEFNTHGIEMPIVGGNTYVNPGTHPELAAAAFDANTAVINHDGESFLAPMDKINPDAVELACNQDGCVLIKDDGNPLNDVIV